jgi:hypothetical protein
MVFCGVIAFNDLATGVHHAFEPAFVRRPADPHVPVGQQRCQDAPPQSVAHRHSDPLLVPAAPVVAVQAGSLKAARHLGRGLASTRVRLHGARHVDTL